MLPSRAHSAYFSKMMPNRTLHLLQQHDFVAEESKSLQCRPFTNWSRPGLLSSWSSKADKKGPSAALLSSQKLTGSYWKKRRCRGVVIMVHLLTLNICHVFIVLGIKYGPYEICLCILVLFTFQCPNNNWIGFVHPLEATTYHHHWSYRWCFLCLQRWHNVACVNCVWTLFIHDSNSESTVCSWPAVGVTVMFRKFQLNKFKI